jgi:hypothetical protein
MIYMKWNIEALIKIDGHKTLAFGVGYNKVKAAHDMIRKIRRDTGFRPVEIIKITANEEDITEEVKEYDERGID